MRAALVAALVVAALVPVGSEAATRCAPTRSDALGPFYEAGAPVRSRVGRGYVLTGRVVDSRCRAIRRARVELWLANPDGQYDDAHRATVFSGPRGGYRFESNRPPSYSGRPPHIHLRITARGFRTLVTQHYPRAGRSTAAFNIVLRRT